MKRGRGNPNFGKFAKSPEIVEPSRWEKFTAEPRTRQQVEAWVKKNVHSAYVPEEVLISLKVKVWA